MTISPSSDSSTANLRNPSVHFGHHDSSTLASSSWSKERAGATSGLPHQCSGAKENIGRLPTRGIRRKKTPVGKRLRIDRRSRGTPSQEPRGRSNAEAIARARVDRESPAQPTVARQPQRPPGARGGGPTASLWYPGRCRASGVNHHKDARTAQRSYRGRIYLNAALQSGYTNPIDQAIVAERRDVSGFRKLDEEPYDFVRKRLSILVAGDGKHLIITKGAVTSVLDICTSAEIATGKVMALSSLRPQIERRFAEFCEQGLRTLGVAYRDAGAEIGIGKGHESDMIFLGLLALDDPLRVGIVSTLQRLQNLGVTLKLITGDNCLVAAHAAHQAGLPDGLILTGSSLNQIGDEALIRRVGEVGIFAEVEPNQKERIILALKKAGNVVGYMGDGINDASALHVADVGISVANAVDVAKEAAEIILLEKDLEVLVRGVREGRTTFANTMKYVFMATSANFGNMFSMAGASLFLSFLPLLPIQILLMNLLTDLPEMTIAADGVDDEMVDSPRRWDIGLIRRFMVVFGVISSFFDFLTFGVLLWLLRASPTQFRTGWFLESVVSASLIVLVVRTRRRFFQSRPGRPLLITTLLVAGFTLLLPYLPLATLLGFEPLPPSVLVASGAVVLLYMITAEAAKAAFYKNRGRQGTERGRARVTRPFLAVR